MMSTTIQTKVEVETVTMTINGKQCSVPKGIPLIAAVEQQGTRIPRLRSEERRVGKEC